MRFALCTSIYEAGRPFFNDWIDASITAAKGHDVRVLIAIDDFVDAQGVCERLSDTVSVSYTHLTLPTKA